MHFNSKAGREKRETSRTGPWGWQRKVSTVFDQVFMSVCVYTYMYVRSL